MPHCASVADIRHALDPAPALFRCFLVLIWSVLLHQPTGGTTTTSRQTLWRVSDYPDPSLHPPEACGFGAVELASVTSQHDNATIWVCDPDHILSSDEAILLGKSLTTVVHKSPCDCKAETCPGSDVSPMGYLIGVALVDRLNTEGMKFEPINVKAANFAKATREKWFAGLGCDDNALVFYSRFSNELYISVGEKMEDVVSDLELAGLYRLGNRYLGPLDADADSVWSSQTTPASTGTVYAGLDAVVRQLNEAILNGPSISSDTIFAFTIPVLLLVVLAAMFLISNVWCAQDISLPGRPESAEAPPGTAEVSPVTAEVSPVTAEVSPVTAEVSPVTAEVSPVTAEVSPVTAEVSPVTAEVSPVTAEVSPVTAEVSPVTADVSPVTAEVHPVKFEVPTGKAEAPPGTSEAPTVHETWKVDELIQIESKSGR